MVIVYDGTRRDVQLGASECLVIGIHGARDVLVVLVGMGMPVKCCIWVDAMAVVALQVLHMDQYVKLTHIGGKYLYIGFQ